MNTMNKRYNDKPEMVLLLRSIAEAGEGKLGQRALASRIGVSLGKANALVNEALEAGSLDCFVAAAPRNDGQYRVTDAGYAFLEPFRVDNAIILTAGFGSRFVPFTYETPKGLLKVNGQPMIESISS